MSDQLLVRAGEVKGWLSRERSRGWSLLAVILGAAVPQTWFSAGKGIGYGDIPPFVAVRHPGELVGVWTHLLDGAGGASFQIARATEAFFWLLPGPPELAQRVFYSVVCASLVASAIWCLSPITTRRWLRAAAALVVLVNPYTITQVPNPLPHVALIGLALTCGSIHRLWRRPGSNWWLAAGLGSLPFSYVVNNPPLVLISGLTIVGFVAVCLFLRRTSWFLIDLAKTAAFGLFVNAWWLSAVALSLRSGDAGGIATTTDVSAWAWTHARSSILNVLTLNSTWAWPYREYFPFAGRLDHQPWNLLRFGLPLVALLAPAVVPKERRRAAWVGVGAVAILVFIGKGLHAPFGGLNLAGYNHIPGAWLLREPGAKVGVPLVLVLALLGTATIDELLDRARASTEKGARVSRALAVSLFLGGSLLYSHPVWTGEVVPRSRPKLPSSRVKVPGEWTTAAHFLNMHDRSGKVLMLPLRTFYQAETTWGYYGADFVPALVERPVVTATPQAYFGSPAPYETLMKQAADSLLSWDRPSLGRAEELLGVETLVIRRDIVASSDEAGPLEAAARRLLGPPAFENSVAAVFDGLGGRLVTGHATLPGGPNGIDVTVDDPLRSAIAFDTPAKTLQVEQPSDVSLGRGYRRVRVSAAPGSDVLQVQQASDVLLDGRPIEPLWEDRLEGARFPAVVASDTLTGIVEGPGKFVDLALRPAGVLRVAPLLGTASPRLDDAHSCAGPASAPIRGVPSKDGVELVAGPGQLVCVSATEPRPPTGDYLALSYTGTTDKGRRPCVLLQPAATCMDLQLQQTTTSDGTNLVWTGAVRGDTTAAQIFLYAEGGPAGETRRVFKDVSLRWFRSLEQTFQGTDEPPRPQRIGAGPHELTITPPTTAGLASFGPAGNCGPDREGTVDGTVSGGSVRLVARGGTACAAAPLLDAQIGANYALQLSYRGEGASACVWLPAARRCADGSGASLPAAADWTPHRLTFSVTEPDPVLFLYAASPGTRQIEASYQGLSFARQPSAEVRVRPVGDVDAGSGGQAVDVSGRRPGEVRVKLNDSGVTSLVLADRYSPKWRLRRLSGKVAVGPHKMVNGYANGWTISGQPGAELAVTYTPDRIVRAATGLSLVTAFAAIVFAGRHFWRRRFALSSGLGEPEVEADEPDGDAPPPDDPDEADERLAAGVLRGQEPVI